MEPISKLHRDQSRSYPPAEIYEILSGRIRASSGDPPSPKPSRGRVERSEGRACEHNKCIANRRLTNNDSNNHPSRNRSLIRIKRFVKARQTHRSAQRNRRMIRVRVG